MSGKETSLTSLVQLFEQMHTGLQREAARAVNSALVVRATGCSGGIFLNSKSQVNPGRSFMVKS